MSTRAEWAIRSRVELCQGRVDEADRQRARAESTGSATRASEWKLNAYYHGGEVAGLNFALAAATAPAEPPAAGLDAMRARVTECGTDAGEP